MEWVHVVDSASVICPNLSPDTRWSPAAVHNFAAALLLDTLLGSPSAGSWWYLTAWQKLERKPLLQYFCYLTESHFTPQWHLQVDSTVLSESHVPRMAKIKMVTASPFESQLPVVPSTGVKVEAQAGTTPTWQNLSWTVFLSRALSILKMAKLPVICSWPLFGKVWGFRWLAGGIAELWAPLWAASQWNLDILGFSTATEFNRHTTTHKHSDVDVAWRLLASLR